MLKIDIKAKAVVSSATMYAVIDRGEALGGGRSGLNFGTILALYPDQGEADSMADDYDGLVIKCQVVISDVEML